MPAIPVIAAYAASSAGVTIAGSTLLGATVVGAVAGGIVAAVQGEDILKGALMGGISGAVVGYAAGGAIGAGETASTAAGTAPSELGAAGQLANAEASNGILAAEDVMATGSTGAMEQAGQSLAGGVDAGGGILSPEAATVNANNANAIAGAEAKASATKLASNDIVKGTVEKGASQDSGKFLSGLDSGEKMMIVSGLAQGAGDAYSSYAANQAQQDLYDQQNNQRQVTGSLLPSDGQIQVNTPVTSSNPNLTARANSIAQSQGLLKPTIQRPTVYKPGVTYA